ncbi:MAG: 50S ribosomal protein L30 [Chloroflexota bacterium]
MKITLVKSTIGRPRKQKANIKALGLSKLNHSVIKANKPFIRGMIFKVKHLVDVAEIMLPMGQEYP